MINVIVGYSKQKLEIMQILFEDKMKWASLGEATYNQAHGESQFLEE
jgi:hypothetical protein